MTEQPWSKVHPHVHETGHYWYYGSETMDLPTILYVVDGRAYATEGVEQSWKAQMMRGRWIGPLKALPKEYTAESLWSNGPPTNGYWWFRSAGQKAKILWVNNGWAKGAEMPGAVEVSKLNGEWKGPLLAGE